ncbi:hypothetical protein TNIN_445591 [Trichonephila inaurata madagascariensis]|uniref:Uncharacterized protein n=1 Tax=Trichonephila inaurata madagascariensis TaxID=2747483 RepID=A0A8X6X178_9ARAC|nr:hypothetical protein TNIN_445591 [Trichonephila inaurata madagascariensis]
MLCLPDKTADFKKEEGATSALGRLTEPGYETSTNALSNTLARLASERQHVTGTFMGGVLTISSKNSILTATYQNKVVKKFHGNGPTITTEGDGPLHLREATSSLMGFSPTGDSCIR